MSNSDILGVKIKNKKTGLYMLSNGRFSKYGKTYSTLSFAKSSITSRLSWFVKEERYKDYEFVVFTNNGSINVIPIKEHLIAKYSEMLKGANESIKYYEKMGEKSTYYENYARRCNDILLELNEEE